MMSPALNPSTISSHATLVIELNVARMTCGTTRITWARRSKIVVSVMASDWAKPITKSRALAAGRMTGSSKDTVEPSDGTTFSRSIHVRNSLRHRWRLLPRRWGFHRRNGCQMPFPTPQTSKQLGPHTCLGLLLKQEAAVSTNASSWKARARDDAGTVEVGIVWRSAYNASRIDAGTSF